MDHPPTSDPGCTTPPLSQIICCKLCFSVYKSPKLLPCLHSFCCLCLSNHCDRNVSQGKATVCPSCSEPFDVPEQGIASLPNNVVLQRAILSNVNQVKIKSPPHYRNRSVTNSDSLTFSDTSIGSELKKCSSNRGSTDIISAEGMFQRENSSENAENDQSGKAAENDLVFMENSVVQHDNVTTVCQSTQENDKSKLEDRRQTPNQSNLTSPSTETDASLFQQEHQKMVKSCSEFSNFSIGSLKFEPPQDYADITEDCYTDNDNTAISSVNHDPIIEEHKQRDRIKDELAGFQTEALGIVYSIDNLNKEKERCIQQKQNLHYQIQQRSARLQGLIKGWERQLLLQVEAHWHDINMTEVIEKYKSYMHNRLKGILAMTDLARMLLDHGLSEELPVFEEMIKNRKQKLNGQKLSFEKPYMKFSIPADEDVVVENLFGSLNVLRKSESYWEFCPATQIPTATSGIDEQVNNRSISEPISGKIISQTDSQTSKSDIKGKSVGSTLACRSPSIEKLKEDRLSTKRSRSSSTRRSFSKQMSPSHPRSRRQSMESPTSEDVKISGGPFTKPVLHAKSPVRQMHRGNSRGYQVSDQSVFSPPSSPTKLGKTSDCTLDFSSGNRRNTEGSIQIDWERDFINTIEQEANRYSDSSRDTAVLNESDRRGQIDDDVQHTRRMLAMCKKQLLEAQTESNPLLQFSSHDVHTGSLPSSPRERFDHLKFSARKKSIKWRSESRDSISSLDGD
ncbi:uncharacterized protein LOC110460784 [Mizuhopecten yessoensis]|uniref:uncharacterized protein LOC110460784 n=1 Tax=Mizuhopecten yessoensis TaxID=6573 RepID=UPI000B4584AB|nr:uncharacterized protein LOC110460784 [Mizuhopecten yessoensis]